MQLHQLDTNLLVALDVLLQERHVTRAAQRLGVTQSAMSQTLQRLRDTLDDPILVRSGRVMVATPRGEALAGPLHSALRTLEQVFHTDAIDPAALNRRFRLTCPDTYAISLVPALLAGVHAIAPRVEIEVVPYDRDGIFDALRNGDVDLGVAGPSDKPRDIHMDVFLEETMLGVVRRDHPFLDGPLTPERYVEWPHIVFRITGRGTYAVDRVLEERGLQRRIVGRTPYFLSAPAIVAQSDFIMTVPASAARVFAQHWPITLFEPPIGAMPYTTHLCWPRWLEADAGHQWLRAEVAGIAGSLGAFGGP